MRTSDANPWTIPALRFVFIRALPGNLDLVLHGLALTEG